VTDVVGSSSELTVGDDGSVSSTTPTSVTSIVVVTVLPLLLSATELPTESLHW
jgi:hypothetical protein